MDCEKKDGLRVVEVITTDQAADPGTASEADMYPTVLPCGGILYCYDCLQKQNCQGNSHAKPASRKKSLTMRAAGGIRKN